MSRYKGVSTLEVLEGADNYNKWISDTVLYRFTSPILEIGAGTGNITQYFTNEKSLYATDVDSKLVTILKKRFVKDKNVICLQLDVEKSSKKYAHFFSAIFGVNVLEHIENDEKALRNMYALLKSGGSLTLLVPAKRLAYTRLDKELGHFRRYEKEELRTKLEKAGFVIDELYYFNIVGLLSWIIRDKVERKNINLKPYQIALFDRLVPIFRKCESIMKPFVGISLIVHARKK